MKPTYVRCGTVIDDVRRIAREHGYAIAVHGSLRQQRDIDLLAAPWVKNAHAASTLFRAVAKLPYLRPDGKGFHERPHGRRGTAYLILHRARGCPVYVDLSIMPRAGTGRARSR